MLFELDPELERIEEREKLELLNPPPPNDFAAASVGNIVTGANNATVNMATVKDVKTFLNMVMYSC